MNSDMQIRLSQIIIFLAKFYYIFDWLAEWCSLSRDWSNAVYFSRSDWMACLLRAFWLVGPYSRDYVTWCVV